MEGGVNTPEVVRERRISRGDLRRLLNDLDTRSVTRGTTVYIRAGSFQECLAGLRPGTGLGPDELTRLADRVEKSATGAVVFWSEDEKLVVLPPFPVEREASMDGWDVSRLEALLDREYMLGVVLLRLGRFAVGVFRGDVLVSSKTDTRYVKGRHSAGGQSQMRFQRIREKQVQEIFGKTCSVVKDQFGPYQEQFDYIFLGGERFTLRGFLKECDYLQKLSDKFHPRTLNVREPNHRALEGVINTIWESRVLYIP